MNIHLLQAAIVVLLLGYPVVVAVIDRRWRARAERTFLEGSRILADDCAALRLEVERARAVADEERAKRERYFLQISEFETQRDHWQGLYNEQSIGHGNAQQLMMGIIEDLARQLQAKGVRVKLPRVIHAVREEYLQTHEMPARASVEELNRALETAKADPVITETPPT